MPTWTRNVGRFRREQEMAFTMERDVQPPTVEAPVNRPRCRRCGGPLDFFFDAETGRQEWVCNNPQPIRSDREHQEAWGSLPGDEVAHLEKTWPPTETTSPPQAEEG